jgi:hypothetical protein
LYEDAEWQADIDDGDLILPPFWWTTKLSAQACARCRVEEHRAAGRLCVAQVMRVGWQRLAKRGLAGFLRSLTKLTALPSHQSEPFSACANQMS